MSHVPATEEELLSQDPAAVAARVVADLWTLGCIAIDAGRESEATRWAVMHGQAYKLLAEMRKRSESRPVDHTTPPG